MESIDKAKKYKLIVELKELLKETINLKDLDISIQASKVLAYIHYNSILSEYYNQKVSEYLNIKISDTNLYYENEQRGYNKFANLAIQCDNSIVLSKYFAVDKLFTNVIDYEFTSVMTHLLLNLPEKTLEKLKNECIYEGIFNYYSLIFHNVLNIKNRQPVILKLPKFSINIQTESGKATLSNLQLLYDFYFLEFKEKQIITADNKYLSEWIYLKIAIIKVLNSLIEYLNSIEICQEIKKEVENTKLTPKEKEVMRFINLSVKEIANKMGTSETTIQTHIKNIGEKTGIKGIKKLRKLNAKF